MSTNQKKLDFRARPKLAPCEKRGLAIIGALFIFVYALVVMILGGQIPGEPFLLLDPTGHLRQGARSWVNSSIPYRERMVPVFIICVYYYMVVMVVNFMTRDWGSIRIWAARYEFWRLSIALLSAIGISVFYFIMLRESPAASSRELSHIFERQAFANRYSFVLMIMMLTVCAYWTAEIISVFIEKVKLLTRWIRNDD